MNILHCSHGVSMLNACKDCGRTTEGRIMATHAHTAGDYFAAAHVCKVCMTKENADLRKKLEEAERKLADAELRGADAARREAARIAVDAVFTYSSDAACAGYVMQQVKARLGQKPTEGV